jgi:hypothetical protein
VALAREAGAGVDRFTFEKGASGSIVLAYPLAQFFDAGVDDEAIKFAKLPLMTSVLGQGEILFPEGTDETLVGFPEQGRDRLVQQIEVAAKLEIRSKYRWPVTPGTAGHPVSVLF